MQLTQTTAFNNAQDLNQQQHFPFFTIFENFSEFMENERLADKTSNSYIDAISQYKFKLLQTKGALS